MFSTPLNPIRYPYHFFRTVLVQPLFWALFLLSPVLGVFQIDVINKQVIFLGNSYPIGFETLGWFPIFFFSCVLIIAGVCTLWGRLFCGWICPHNTMSEWLQPIRMLIGFGQKPYFVTNWERKFPFLKVGHKLLSIGWATAVVYIIGTLIIFYFLPPAWYVERIQTGTMPFIVWASTFMTMILGYYFLYSGHWFCRSACPYGLLQALSAYQGGKWTPMEIRYQYGENLNPCKACRACESACPIDIDPRNPKNLVVGIGEGCFNCGECIDACHYVQHYHGKQGFLRFKTPFSKPDGLSAHPDYRL